MLSGQSRTESWRRIQLNRLKKALEFFEEEIINALAKDLDKPSTEAFFEVIALRQEIKVALENLTKWMRPKHIQIPISLKPGSASIHYQPLGCVLIIGPWNYPFSLTLQPLINAFAAGNTAVLKPSEHAPETSNLIHKIISRNFPRDVVRVIEGDGSIAEKLISEGFDHIFFTGGGAIGKKVMQAASNHLTPVTLELGGKSPAIILEGADLSVTAKRLIWGKGLNAGQTCIAPDHLLIEERLKSTLITSMKIAINNFYGKDPLNSNNLAKIINKSHFNRLKKLIDKAYENQQIIYGGTYDENKRKISPTLIEVSSREDPLMQQEIFGPLMPILTFKNFEKALIEIRKQAKPLALYMFGGTSEQQLKVINTTSSGGVCFNDVVLQAGIPDLPFGGIGASGMGNYHGYAGFETFSHKRSVLKKPFWLDINFRYPPYKIDIPLLKKLLG